ncbi:hypothetical protein KIN20_004589 [Parelaphostrongylus tenuis]|uniref:Uncharacterized protein n=1 Tax=Parelaphostrongylus tenuis TaxID=148309 RepID=A0AAD5QI37_PARTN|nr:hypothetical protein KIN20_004589 [Parelaphostrongylus tenuis]
MARCRTGDVVKLWNNKHCSCGCYIISKCWKYSSVCRITFWINLRICSTMHRLHEKITYGGSTDIYKENHPFHNHRLGFFKLLCTIFYLVKSQAQKSNENALFGQKVLYMCVPQYVVDDITESS